MFTMTTIKRSEDEYPMTRSQVKWKNDAEIIVSEWKKEFGIQSVNDELDYMQTFNGKMLPVYQPEWHNNRHQPYYYQGREMKYQGDELFVFGDVADGHKKMFVIAETDEWLMGFQFNHYVASFQGDYTGFLRLEMTAVHR